MNQDILNSLLNHVDAWPEKAILIEHGRIISYKQFWEGVLSVHEILHRMGVGEGDRVGVLAHQYLSVMTVTVGAWLSEATCSPVPLSTPLSQRRQLLGALDPAVIFAEEGVTCPFAGAPVKNISQVSKLRGRLSTFPFNEDRDALVLFTSGSTGHPKGAVLSYRSVCENANVAAVGFELTQVDRFLVNSPPYYTTGMSHFMACVTVGGTLVAEQGFKFSNDLVRAMADHQCTGFGGAPSHLIRLLNTFGGELPESMKFWTVTGDYISKDSLQDAQEYFPSIKFFVGYGMTEVGGRVSAIQAHALPTKLGSVGKPFEIHKITIRNEEGDAVECGTEGEIHISGRSLMKGYLGEARCESHATGDIGIIDSDGYLWICGRVDDMIKCGGIKVSLKHIQSAILDTKTCLDAAVTADPHHELGKMVHAYVCLKNNQTLEQLKSALRLKLSLAELPKLFTVVDSIPRRPSGKMDLPRIAAL